MCTSLDPARSNMRKTVASSLLVALLGILPTGWAAAQDLTAKRSSDSTFVGMESDSAVGKSESARRPDASVDLIYLEIRSNYPEALVYADSTLIGSLRSGYVGVPASTSILRLTPPKMNAWSVQPVEHELDAQAGDTLSLTLNFPYYYRIESVPYGASVHVDAGTNLIDIGSTPLVYDAPAPPEGDFIITLPGYVRERIEPGDDIWNRYVVTLSPSNERDLHSTQIDWKPPRKRRAWIDYAAIGTALVAGAVAVHYKFRADDLYDAYQESGDPALRPAIKRYDVRSGIAFGVMQAGIGVFAVRLVLR